MPELNSPFLNSQISPLCYTRPAFTLSSFISLGQRDDDTQSMPDVRSEYKTHSWRCEENRKYIVGVVTE